MGQLGGQACRKNSDGNARSEGAGDVTCAQLPTKAASGRQAPALLSAVKGVVLTHLDPLMIMRVFSKLNWTQLAGFPGLQEASLRLLPKRVTISDIGLKSGCWGTSTVWQWWCCPSDLACGAAQGKHLAWQWGAAQGKHLAWQWDSTQSTYNSKALLGMQWYLCQTVPPRWHPLPWRDAPCSQ